MRILLSADPMIPVPPTGYGGIERIVDGLVRAYRARGHTVGLLAHRASTAPADHRMAWAGTATSGLSILWHSWRMWRAVREFSPDVIHSFSRLAYLAPLLSRRLPKVMSYQRHTGPRQIIRAVRLAGGSLSFTACSEFIRRQGAPGGGDWQVIPNFIEPEKITFSPAVPPDAPLVFLSRINAEKGTDLAIAVAQSAGRRLIIAGNHAATGPEHDFWQQAVAPHLGRMGVSYVGEIDDAQKNQLLGQAAALLVPIRWDEPFGIVFPEALAAGTPVITCARGALPEIIRPGFNGFFMDDIPSGVRAVQALPSLDRAACRRDAVERFSRDLCAGRYLALLSARLAASGAD